MLYISFGKNEIDRTIGASMRVLVRWGGGGGSGGLFLCTSLSPGRTLCFCHRTEGATADHGTTGD